MTLTDISTTWAEVIIPVDSDDFRSGCRNISKCHLKQSFSGLHSPRWSQFIDLYRYLRPLWILSCFSLKMGHRFCHFAVGLCMVLPFWSKLSMVFKRTTKNHNQYYYCQLYEQIFLCLMLNVCVFMIAHLRFYFKFLGSLRKPLKSLRVEHKKLTV